MKFFATRCGNCGSTKHRIKDCDKPWSACSYEHDGARGLPKHSLRCCPILHNYCRICFLRGHDASAHEIRQFTQRELRQRFLLNQPRGLLTSILLLTTRPQGHEDLVMSHWRFGLMGQNFNRDNISRFYLRVPTGKHLGMDLGNGTDVSFPKSICNFNFSNQSIFTRNNPRDSLPPPFSPRCILTDLNNHIIFLDIFRMFLPLSSRAQQGNNLRLEPLPKVLLNFDLIFESILKTNSRCW